MLLYPPTLYHVRLMRVAQNAPAQHRCAPIRAQVYRRVPRWAADVRPSWTACADVIAPQKRTRHDFSRRCEDCRFIPPRSQAAPLAQASGRGVRDVPDIS